MIIRTLALLSFILVLPASGFAQSSDEEMRYYDVEIIIFKNVRVPKGNELALPVSSPKMDVDILDLSSPESIEAAKEKSYEILPVEEFRLLERAEKIIASPYYDLLTHIVWRQPGLDKENAMPIWIRAGREFGNDYVSIDSQIPGLPETDEVEQVEESSNSPEILQPETEIPTSQQPIYELEGKITIELARYLHAHTDLVLRRPRLAIEQLPEDPELTAELPTADLADTRILNNHNLKESRRMRSKSLHYLDNPEFGMLILITPYIVKEVETSDTQSTQSPS